MQPISQNHVTLLLLLSDGSHRTTNWYSSQTNAAVMRALADQVRCLSKGVEVVTCFLAAGAQHLQYSATDVLALVGRVKL